MKKYLLLGLLITAFISTGCGKKEPPRVEDAASSSDTQEASSSGAKKDGVEHKVLSFNLEGLTDKGEKKWEVIGRTARSISENEIRLGDIIAKTYGDQEAVITADQGVYDKSKNNVRLEKNVKATIENAGSVMKDQIGFPIDTVASEKKDLPGNRKKIVITCDGEVEFDYAKNLAYFRKNVKVRSEDGDIDADRITVNLDPKTKKINDIVADGRVKITQKENVAYSDNAKYSEADKKVLLSGSPKIEMAQDTGDSFVKDRFPER
ncbi:MAG: LptA/OstA family protein [Candidatus Omnitrophota bacterium]|nr:LptA/OstA family protein [Candidatus Omnitrophota bacterium]